MRVQIGNNNIPPAPQAPRHELLVVGLGPPLPHPAVLLRVRHDLQRQAAGVQGQAEGVRHMDRGAAADTALALAERGGRDGVDGDDGHLAQRDPDRLRRPGGEEPRRRLLHRVEAGVLAVAQDAPEEVGSDCARRVHIVK